MKNLLFFMILLMVSVVCYATVEVGVEMSLWENIQAIFWYAVGIFVTGIAGLLSVKVISLLDEFKLRFKDSRYYEGIEHTMDIAIGAVLEVKEKIVDDIKDTFPKGSKERKDALANAKIEAVNLVEERMDEDTKAEIVSRNPKKVLRNILGNVVEDQLARLKNRLF